uniref:Uncharacterized protein n=1 Tax=Plectus sambesii TaxID=2011161 RepID=A0A914USM7_9BILA
MAMGEEKSRQWAVPKEAIDSVNRSTVTFLENAAKLCVTGVPALASLLSYKASAVNALLPPSNSSPLANVPRCQTCHLAHHNPADHSVRLASNRRPNAKRLRRAIARQARQSASPFDKHVLACADRSSTPTVVLLCPGCGAENRIGRLTTSSTKKSTQLDDDARNEPSSSTVSIEPNHAVHARKRKRRKAAVDAFLNLSLLLCRSFSHSGGMSFSRTEKTNLNK